MEELDDDTTSLRHSEAARLLDCSRQLSSFALEYVVEGNRIRLP